ncbi:MAG TPA: glutaminyl-peptide cyclotransferase, partial [Pyrinomonadaceae bacterium]|nr:glutaminyl-peptide cyclotransferase [Pyrinomonadaceae bacterium]
MRTYSAATLALLLFMTLPACGDRGSAANSSAPPASSSPSPAASSATPVEDVPVYTYEIVETYPHDTKAYTQGLVFYDGMLYESTGQYGESSLRRVELKKGKVKKKIEVPGQYFAEGMTI